MAAPETYGKVSVAEDARIVVKPTDADLIKRLPPLPRPDYCTQLGETSMGVFTILAVIGLVLGLTWFFTSGDEFAPTARSLLLSIVFTESFLALFCLLALLFGDPGTIRRSHKTCIPIPEEIAERLQNQEAMPQKNVRGKDGDRTFCVRCFVWRPKMPMETGLVARVVNAAPSFGIVDSEPYYQSGHHCGVCQRCVQDFDHHCSFYGRCITRKNMFYFKSIISIGLLAGFTLICFVPVVLWYEHGQDASLISIAVIASVSVCCGCCAACMKMFDI